MNDRHRTHGTSILASGKPASYFNAFPISDVSVHEGSELTVRRVSRLHMGAYLCIASNGVPPAMSRRIQLQVNCKHLSQFEVLRNSNESVISDRCVEM